MIRSALTSKILSIPSRTKTFKNGFFNCFIDEWNTLKPENRNSESIQTFER